MLRCYQVNGAAAVAATPTLEPSSTPFTLGTFDFAEPQAGTRTSAGVVIEESTVIDLAAGVVIGPTATRVPVASAMDHVFGYSSRTTSRAGPDAADLLQRRRHGQLYLRRRGHAGEPRRRTLTTTGGEPPPSRAHGED
jgi:hypothetical protein